MTQLITGDLHLGNAPQIKDTFKRLREAALSNGHVLAVRHQGTDRGKVFIMQEQFRFPRSKKKRIRKKWAKNPRNFRPFQRKPQYHFVTRDFEQHEPIMCPWDQFHLPEGKLETGRRVLSFVDRDTLEPCQISLSEDSSIYRWLYDLGFIDPRKSVESVHDEIDVKPIPPDTTVAEAFEGMRKQIAVGLGIPPEVMETHTGRRIETPVVESEE